MKYLEHQGVLRPLATASEIVADAGCIVVVFGGLNVVVPNGDPRFEPLMDHLKINTLGPLHGEDR